MYYVVDLMGRPKITAEKHILIYLWFVGHENASYRDVADRFGITISALHKVISRVTNFIMFLAPNIIKYPTLDEKVRTATFYETAKGFPNVIGNIHFHFYILKFFNTNMCVYVLTLHMIFFHQVPLMALMFELIDHQKILIHI